MVDSDSRALVQDASAGDGAALDALLRRHLPGLRAFVRLRAGELLRAQEGSMDLVQSACREVLQDLDAFRWQSEGLFKHWLYQAALRKIRDRAKYWARERRDPRRVVPLVETASDSEPAMPAGYGNLFTPSREAAAHEEIACFEAAFAELPAPYQDVITLAKLVGLSRQEIGRELGKSEEAVRSLLHRALARLTSLMRKQGLAGEAE